jgi:hypothetical protein
MVQVPNDVGAARYFHTKLAPMQFCLEPVHATLSENSEHFVSARPNLVPIQENHAKHLNRCKMVFEPVQVGFLGSLYRLKPSFEPMQELGFGRLKSVHPGVEPVQVYPETSIQFWD